MAVESPPFATQAGSFPAEQTRRGIFSHYARSGASVSAQGSPGILTGGIIGVTDLTLTAPASGMSVNVGVGEAIVGGSEGGSQGGYYFYASSTTNLAIATANGTNPRIDTVVATVADAGYTIPTGGTSGQVTLQVVTGTPTAGATLSNLLGKGSMPASSLLLGYVLVPASATNIVSGDIDNVAALVSHQYDAATDTGWQNLTLGTGVSALGSGSYTPQARRVGFVVYWRGGISTTTSNTGAIATVPAGFSLAPTETVGAAIVDDAGGHYEGSINTSGLLTLTSLSGVSIGNLQLEPVLYPAF